MSISRRQFITGGSALLGAGVIKPAWSKLIPTPLPIPPLVDGTEGIPVKLDIRNGHWSFMPGIKTPTLGLNLDYLGPTIRTRQNTQLNLHYYNNLTEGVAVHGHGLHVPGNVDGGPQLEIAPGDQWQPELSIVQPAATCWYHSHSHGRTGYQVYHGLAGMIIIDDELSVSLSLPDRYGIDDLPIIIQDRTFDSQGKLVYSLNDADEDGWYGESVFINGALSPVANVPAGKVRLRLLNGANARFYILTFADNRLFHKIASDGGFLAEPVPMTAMEIAPGERCEIIVDLSDSKPAELLTLFENEYDNEGVLGSLIERIARLGKPQAQPSLTLKPDKTLTPNNTPLPDQLAEIIRPQPSQIIRTREFVLKMDDHGDHNGKANHAMMDMTINDAAMDMNVINEQVKLGEWERWRIRADQGEHPFHVHGCSFLIDLIEGEAVPPDQQGWKDIVVLDDDGWSEILVRFDHPATQQHPYMYHCHILEHEDRGMMGQFTVG